MSFTKASQVLALSAFLGASFMAHGAAKTIDTTPSQKQVPSGKGGMTIGKGDSNSAVNASGATAEGGRGGEEASRVARLKKEISDGQNTNPALDKLGQYLGKDY